MRHVFGILWYDLPKGIIKCTQDPCIFYLLCVPSNIENTTSQTIPSDCVFLTHDTHHPISYIRVNRFNCLLYLCRCIMLYALLLLLLSLLPLLPVAFFSLEPLCKHIHYAMYILNMFHYSSLYAVH